MTPTELKAYLDNLVNKQLQISTMIWQDGNRVVRATARANLQQRSFV